MLLVSVTLVTKGTEPNDQSQHREEGERRSHALMAYMLLKLSALLVRVTINGDWMRVGTFYTPEM